MLRNRPVRHPALLRRLGRAQLRTRVLAGVLAIMLAALVAFDFAAVTALRGYLLGHTDERVIRAPRGGRFQPAPSVRIGQAVRPMQVVGTVDGEPVRTAIGGLLRGLIADGVLVEGGMKLGDVDPRGPSVDPARISDKARAVAAGVLEAIMVGTKLR